MQILLGLIIAAFIAYAAFRARSLSHSGAFAAALVGAVIFGMGGWQWAVLLMGFFITSSALSRAFQRQKQNLNEKFSKGSERDAAQVFGNGGLATLFAALHFFFPLAVFPWVGFAAALAAVNADTWATELGVLNPHPPRMITNPSKIVEKGTSGGISLYGTLAALAGAGWIALLAVLLLPAELSAPTPLFFPITLAGLLAALFDSFLGATVQAMYLCRLESKETEKHPFHTCGAETLPLRGWMWLDNDRVNFACAVFGAGAALLWLA